MMLQNLHCHNLYDDGESSLEDMILAAYRAGLTSIGISAHSPIEGQDWCTDKKNIDAFKRDMASLAEKYRGVIPVYCGLEYDTTSEKCFDGYEYIIVSRHYVRGYPVDNTQGAARQLIEEGFGGDSMKAAEEYFSGYEAIARMPECDIVGHFDLLSKYNELESMYDVSDRRYRDAAFAALETLSRAGKIIEINTGAVSRGYRTSFYPAPELLCHLNSIGGRVCVASDAHSASAVAFGLEDAAALAAQCGFSELWQFDGKRFTGCKF